jgi:hypothetical protein
MSDTTDFPFCFRTIESFGATEQLCWEKVEQGRNQQNCAIPRRVELQKETAVELKDATWIPAHHTAGFPPFFLLQAPVDRRVTKSVPLHQLHPQLKGNY